jgi:CubicO group peptidase (beta-lactamase class C family)
MKRSMQTASIALAVGALATIGWLSSGSSQGGKPATAQTTPVSNPTTPVQATSVAQPPPRALGGDLDADRQIRQVLEVTLKSANLPAMSAAVVRGGRVLGSATVGVRKMKNPTPAASDDPFHLGNCTKAFTGVLIGRMIDEGSLRWDSTIAEVLGREIAGIHPDLAGVTVEQLLRHRSGLLARGPNDVWTAAQRAKGTPTEQRLAYVEAMITKAPAKPPGQHQYSNVGYAVLGLMAETVAGKPYEELVRDRVLRPLGITTAGFGQAGDPKSVTAPWPHLDGAPSFTDNPACVAPGMTLHMSIGDWAKFANFELGHQPTPPLLTNGTFARLQELAGEVKDDEMGYACGWFRPLRAWAGGRALHHVGSNTVNFCEIWLAPALDFGVLVCSNEGSPDAAEACEAASAALIQRFLGVDPGPLESARDRRNPVMPPKR